MLQSCVHIYSKHLLEILNIIEKTYVKKMKLLNIHFIAVTWNQNCLTMYCLFSLKFRQIWVLPNLKSTMEYFNGMRV